MSAAKCRTKEELSAYNAAYHLAHKDVVNADRRAKRNQDPQAARLESSRYREANPERSILSAAKTRAKRRGLDFDLSPEDIIVPKYCPILGLELRHSRGSTGPAPCSPSLDRVDPTLGYVKGNVQVISNMANTMKSSATPNQLKQFAAWVNRTVGRDA